MFNLEKLKKMYDLKSGSKLCLSLDKNLDIIFEVKNLNNLSAQLLLFILIDKMVEEEIIDKKTLKKMVDELY